MRALDILEKTIVKNSIQYAIGLPWEKEETKLPYNRDLAVNKFKSTKNKFNKNTETMTKYEETVNSCTENECTRITFPIIC